MNSFARYLFQGIFSWLREAARQLSDPGVLDSWLATHWLGTVLFLLLVGTLVDFGVWLVRWRPDLVWRSSMRKSAALLNMEGRQMRRFRKGYRHENAEISAIAQPRPDAPVPDAVQAYMEEQRERENSQDAFIDWQFQEAAVQETPAETPPVRHRRSDRYRRGVKKPQEEPRRFSLTEADDDPVDGLPPVISKQEAFRAPVYPRQPDQDDRA